MPDLLSFCRARGTNRNDMSMSLLSRKSQAFFVKLIQLPDSFRREPGVGSRVLKQNSLAFVPPCIGDMGQRP